MSRAYYKRFIFGKKFFPIEISITHKCMRRSISLTDTFRVMALIRSRLASCKVIRIPNVGFNFISFFFIAHAENLNIEVISFLITCAKPEGELIM